MLTYPQALAQLAQAIRQPHNAAGYENWHFQAVSLSVEQVAAIRAHTQNQLPESYYQFIAACGTGDFFCRPVPQHTRWRNHADALRYVLQPSRAGGAK